MLTLSKCNSIWKIEQHVEKACLSSFFQWKLKFECSFQQREHRAIWHILALVNKFSLYPLHGNAIIGNAQIFETLRLWRPLEPRENATSRVLFIHKIVAISVCLSVFLFFSNLWKMLVFLLKKTDLYTILIEFIFKIQFFVCFLQFWGFYGLFLIEMRYP